MNPIPYGKQQITDEDIDAVISVLRSDYLTQGPKIEEFEEKFAAYVNARYAVAVANGTAALHLSAVALGVDNRSKVITTPITFAASANCVRYCGGEVFFADIDHNSILLDLDHVRAVLKRHKKGTFQGIIPVDFAGRAVNMEEFKMLADQYGLWIIEDACHAPGGYFKDALGVKQMCGNGMFADLAVFSFHPVKHIATGEGGMITTNDEKLYRKLLTLRNHGITRQQKYFVNTKKFASGEDTAEYPEWYMEMQDLGFNYRLTDFQSALGISQLKQADSRLARRRAIASKYAEAFEGRSFLRWQSGKVDGHAYHLYIIEVENRLGLYKTLRKQNIFGQIHYVPAHLMPYYRQFGWKEGDLPNAEMYYKHCISLPMFPTLTDHEQEGIIKAILKFYGE